MKRSRPDGRVSAAASATTTTAKPGNTAEAATEASTITPGIHLYDIKQRIKGTTKIWHMKGPAIVRD